MVHTPLLMRDNLSRATELTWNNGSTTCQDGTGKPHQVEEEEDTSTESGRNIHHSCVQLFSAQRSGRRMAHLALDFIDGLVSFRVNGNQHSSSTNHKDTVVLGSSNQLTIFDKLHLAVSRDSIYRQITMCEVRNWSFASQKECLPRFANMSAFLISKTPVKHERGKP